MIWPCGGGGISFQHSIDLVLKTRIGSVDGAEFIVVSASIKYF